MQDGGEIVETKAETDSIIGTVLDERFEIVAKLGRGAFASVYKARHLQLDKFFAVKIMHTKAAPGSSQLARFLGEAAALQKLKHPNIVGVSGSGLTEDGRSFIILEYVESESLGSYVDIQGPLPWDVAKPLFMQILDGIAHAHAQEIVHRDLKPDNILVFESPELTPKIVDFGIAKWVNPDSVSQKLTKTGTLVGTPLYMSPEQANGGSLSAATDIYSAGCVLYYCLTGHPPFEASNPFETLMRHQNETLPVVPSVGADVNHVLSTAMAKRPEARYASAVEFREAMEGCESQSAKFVTDSKKKSRKVSVPLTALCFIAAVIVMAGAFLLSVYSGSSLHANTLKTLDDLCRQGVENVRQARFGPGMDAFRKAFELADKENLVLPQDAMLNLQEACDMLDHDADRNIKTSIPWMQELVPLAIRQFSKSPAYYQLAQKFADENSELAFCELEEITKLRQSGKLPAMPLPTPELEAVVATNHQLVDTLNLVNRSRVGSTYERNNPMLFHRAADSSFRFGFAYLKLARVEANPKRRKALKAQSKELFDDLNTILDLKKSKDDTDVKFRTDASDGLRQLNAIP